MDHSIVLKSYGKINLGLDVLRRREDGYHEVRMIMQTVGLYDVLTMKKRKDDKIEMTCNLSFLPTDERNLVYKAVKLIKDKYHIKDGVEINLSKRIPVAAGMAGGSSNCAAALKGMNQLFDLGLSIDELCEIGVTLGADVPYCIWGGTALSEGIGEKLSRVDAMPDCYILIAKPGMDIREQVFASCVNHGFVILQMNPVSKSLEDVFLELTEKEGTQKEVLPEKKLHFVKSHFGKESKEDGE